MITEPTKNPNTHSDYRLEGSLLELVYYPDPILKNIAKPVEVFDKNLETLIKNMLFTMYKSPGIGLAAPQVGLAKRIFVIDTHYQRESVTRADGAEEVDYSHFQPHVFINPSLSLSGEKDIYEEGCLSLPGIYEPISRYSHVAIEYFNTDGKKCSMEAEELLAICIQHENDHLNGVVFIDWLSSFKKNFYKKKLLKEKKNR